ncbi:MAG: glycosyltransferase family 4 protein [Desulfobacterales bacterium]|nr:glycosyltransferase family 4 protein [Desulfobacterales bacterium]
MTEDNACKVLHIITRLDRGGSALNTLVTCRGLCRKYDTLLASGLSLESEMVLSERRLVEEGIGEARQKGARVCTVPSLVRRINPPADLKAFWTLYRLIKKEKAAIVHTHSSKAGLLGRWAAWLAGAPHIVHTPHGHVFYGHFGSAASWLFLMLERITDRITDQTIALTEAERDDYIRFRVSKPEKLVVIHSGVEIERFKTPAGAPDALRRSLRISKNAAVVGFVGWLLPIKDPLTLLSAMEQVWEKVENAVVVFVGKGELAPVLKKRAEALGAEKKVILTGWRPDIPALMHMFDMFVLPSRNEGMGRVLVEAMAAGKPVIGSRTGGITDLIKHGENGYLFEPGNAAELAKFIIEIAQKPFLRKQMGEKGRVIAKNYSIERMIQMLDELYTAVLQTAPALDSSRYSQSNPAHLD